RANDIEAIGRTYGNGAHLIDIAASNVNGVLYAEHGIVPQFESHPGELHIKSHLPMVIDRDEEEFKLGMPEYTYEALIAYVASLDTDENPLAVSTELKRGKFGRGVVSMLFDIHQRYDIPVRVHSKVPRRLGL